jgi:hypothetical protein
MRDSSRDRGATWRQEPTESNDAAQAASPQISPGAQLCAHDRRQNIGLFLTDR